MKQFEIGVGELVSYVFRSGSIDNRSGSKSRMLLGTKIHQIIQEQDSKVKDNYQKEVYFKFPLIYRDSEFLLTGRADAIYFKNGKPVIEEIKTTNRYKSKKFEPEEAHLAQLLFYGYFYAVENNLKSIQLCLHYYHIPTEEHSYFKKKYSLAQLREQIENVLGKWLEIGFIKEDWINIRNKSINELDFIYNSFRKGQREISLAVYNTIKRNEKAFIEAPTGIGKTIGTIFPSVKTLINNPDTQIYYLSAKTTIQQEANKALNKMREKGLQIKSTTITARDKICFLNQEKPNSRNCNPDDCEFAKDYYKKINPLLIQILKGNSHFDRDFIEKFAYENKICPYQLSLDLSRWSDIIICDYNYVFDPISSLEGFNNKRICLVDEAHNLPDRSRSMYSAEINSSTFYKLRNILNKKDLTEKENKRLKVHVNRIIYYLQDLKEELETLEGDNIEISQKLINQINQKIFNFQTATIRYQDKVKKEKVIKDDEILAGLNECSYELFRFSAISNLEVKDQYFNYVKLENNNVIIRLVCLDPSTYLTEKIKDNPVIFFSATLTPFDYYKNIILGEDDIPEIALPSPFDKDNYMVICDDSISTRYNDRAMSYYDLAEILKTFVLSNKGNYLFFFPSYNYLSAVYEIFDKLVNKEGFNLLVQKSSMDDSERKRFLDNFKGKQPTIGFCVMGGIFSEGIDLPLDSLIGTAIIGPGIPGIDFERDLLKQYFQEENGNGYAYAYAYPGMNRVLQSAGRVIRTDKDKGVILLIDDRFRSPFYKRMIPEHLKPYYLNNPKDLKIKLEEFWNKTDLIKKET